MRISDWSSDVCSSDLTSFGRTCSPGSLGWLGVVAFPLLPTCPSLPLPWPQGTLAMIRHAFALALLFAATTVFAEPVAIGSTLPSYTLTDQFGKEHSLEPETSEVVLSFEMDVSTMHNGYRGGQKGDRKRVVMGKSV